jgi:hypothetical protein
VPVLTRLESRLRGTSSDEQIEDIQAFAASIAEGLANSDDDFDFRRFVIETLDVWATLTVEDDEKIVYVRCVLGERELAIESTTIRG